tara:strand:+ start:3612 stop:5123 length:1512 start_codon:yes stop_codon:yes gene_type:complete
MDSKQAFRILNELESKLNLEKFKVNGIDIWPHIRFQFIIKINRRILNIDPRKQSYLPRVWAKLKIAPSAVLGIIRIYYAHLKNEHSSDRQRDIVFLTDSHCKRMKLDDGWYDSFIDPIIDHYEKLNVTHHTFETSQRFIIRYPSKRDSQPISMEMILYFLRSLLFVWRVRFNQDFLEVYYNYRNHMVDMGMKEDVIGLQELKFEVSYIFQLMSFFHRKLEKIKPRLVFMTSSSGYSASALICICNKLSITSINIQHGVQGKYHPSYASFNNIPREAFNTLPRFFLTWSKADRDNINKWASNTVSIRATMLGNLYEETFKVDNALSLYFDRLFTKYYGSHHNKVFVLISLTWSNYLPTEIKKLLHESGDKYFFLIRLHPCTTSVERKVVKSELKSLGRNNYDIEQASELPLYAIIRNVHFNITQRSSTVIDCSNFGVTSIITDDIGHMYYQDLINSQNAYYCASGDGLYSQLEKLVNTEVPDNCDRRNIKDQLSDLSVLDTLLE